MLWTHVGGASVFRLGPYGTRRRRFGHAARGYPRDDPSEASHLAGDGRSEFQISRRIFHFSGGDRLARFHLASLPHPASGADRSCVNSSGQCWAPESICLHRKHASVLNFVHYLSDTPTRWTLGLTPTPDWPPYRRILLQPRGVIAALTIPMAPKGAVGGRRVNSYKHGAASI